MHQGSDLEEVESKVDLSRQEVGNRYNIACYFWTTKLKSCRHTEQGACRSRHDPWEGQWEEFSVVQQAALGGRSSTYQLVEADVCHNGHMGHEVEAGEAHSHEEDSPPDRHQEDRNQDGRRDEGEGEEGLSSCSRHSHDEVADGPQDSHDSP